MTTRTTTRPGATARAARRRTAAIAGVSALAAAALTASLTVPGLASADDDAARPAAPAPAVPAPPAVPTNVNQIQNIDQVRTAIKGYYGDRTTDTPDPVDGSTTLHQFANTGNYAKQVRRITLRATGYLSKRFKAAERDGDKPAILFDIDDTSLNTYSYEIYSNFNYNPSVNAEFVNAGSADVFPGVPIMANVSARAQKWGYTQFFLTGRPASQLEGTKANLTDAGFDYDADNVYLKDLSAPWLSSCAPTCTTVQYKSLTRKHIESLGYEIVGNFGDQYSDLRGGYADRGFELPNPMYYLP